MKKLIDQIKKMHPSAAFAAVGGILFSIGGIWVFVDTVPNALMWIGGAMVFAAFMTSIDGGCE